MKDFEIEYEDMSGEPAFYTLQAENEDDAQARFEDECMDYVEIINIVEL